MAIFYNGKRSPNLIVNCPIANFQFLIGIVHFLEILFIAKYSSFITDSSLGNTYSFEIVKGSNFAIDKEGNIIKNLFIFGIPTEGIRWATFAGIRPYVGSIIIKESFEIAHQIIEDWINK